MSEASKEGDRLLKTVLSVSMEESERDHSIRILSLFSRGEELLDCLREVDIMIHDGRGVLNVSLAIREFLKATVFA